LLASNTNSSCTSANSSANTGAGADTGAGASAFSSFEILSAWRQLLAE